MPECAEVKLCADAIRPLVQGMVIHNAFATSHGRYSQDPPVGYQDFYESINNNTVKVKDIKTKGKFMWWEFDDGSYMFSTFGMSGMWAPRQEKHPCFVFDLSDNNYTNHKQIAFNDPRHFGTIKFTNNKQDLIDKLNGLGWDGLSEELTQSVIDNLHQKLSKTNKPIGQMLLDQSLFTGVGNYIRAEVLFASKISPWRPCNLLTRADIGAICAAIVKVMQEAYQNNGASLHTYKDAHGNRGNYADFFKVYGQKLDPLGNKIVKEKTPDGRTIHWSPQVQQ